MDGCRAPCHAHTHTHSYSRGKKGSRYQVLQLIICEPVSALECTAGASSTACCTCWCAMNHQDIRPAATLPAQQTAQSWVRSQRLVSNIMQFDTRGGRSWVCVMLKLVCQRVIDHWPSLERSESFSSWRHLHSLGPSCCCCLHLALHPALCQRTPLNDLSATLSAQDAVHSHPNAVRKPLKQPSLLVVVCVCTRRAE